MRSSAGAIRSGFKARSVLTDTARVLRHTLRTFTRAMQPPTAGGADASSLGEAVTYLSIAIAVLASTLAGIEAAAGVVHVGDLPLVGLAIACAAAARAGLASRTAHGAEVLLSAMSGLVILGIWSHPVAGAAMSPLALLLIWPILLVCYFLPLWRAAVQVVWIGAAYLAALAASGQLEHAGMRVGLLVVALGTVAPVVGMVRLRAEMAVMYLQEAAVRDPLTALLNRRGFDAALEQAQASCAADDTSLSVLVADIDYFKAINERFGHRVGDDLLVEVSTILHVEAGLDAIPARIGGEEFAVIVPGCDVDEGIALAERLRDAVQRTFASSATQVTMSFGAASCRARDARAVRLLHDADQALFAAKELGRNRAVGFSDDVIEVLERARIRWEEQSRNQLATLLTLAEALDLRDPSTALHSRTVADYAEGMARELGLDDDLVERVRLAGLLHDIGKIGIPDSVLLKPGKLTDEQWAQMREHPQIGARMLNQVEYADIRDWVMSHHERPDGRGYPHGLAGDEIPIGARILAVADSYEAMTADRVYRKAPGHEFARGELTKCTGTQFDGAVVEAMDRLLQARGLGIIDDDGAGDVAQAA